ncbi:hypothetical protein [Fusobacterium nucleatum]|uniref:hypothetical protein n=1 Tax=Fusobacterium nucleatum TaxID=851 RepID=UPI003D8187E9|nr:hypothetical protein [Fusobacterium nucleatum YWH7054]
MSKENREKYRTMAEPDLTINKEFYAFGKTRLYQSVYGSVKRLENGKYDVDITVMFQYTDRFEDVKNINNSSVEKQGLNKEFEVGTNILIFFYIFKEPYFFLSKYKILILLISIIIGYSSLIFLQKIRIKLSLNFFKEIIKIFLISGIIYYFPIVCVQILLNIFLKIF